MVKESLKSITEVENIKEMKRKEKGKAGRKRGSHSNLK